MSWTGINRPEAHSDTGFLPDGGDPGEVLTVGNDGRLAWADPGAAAPGGAATADTIAELRLLPPPDGAVSVLGYYAPGDGGGGQFRFDNSSNTPENGGTVIAPATGTGRWLRVIDQESLSILQFGARKTGNATAQIQAAIDASVGLFVLTIPKGTFNITTLQIPSYAKIRGAGRDTILKSNVTGTTAIIRNKTAAVGATTGVEISSLTIQGTDGSGGTGLWMDSWDHALITNVWIDLCRNAANTGRGVYMCNNLALCYNNSFYSLRIGNCDDGIVMEGTSAGGIHSCGYNTFVSLWIDQEINGIKLLYGTGNGGIYNKFYGFSFQGNGAAGAAGTIMYLNAALGNRFLDVVLDQFNGTILSLDAAAGNYISVITGWDPTKFIDVNPVGAPNVIDVGSNLTYSPGKPYYLRDAACNFEVECADQATASTNGSIHTKGGIGVAKDLRVGGNIFALYFYGGVVASALGVTGLTAVDDDITVNSGTPDLGKSGARFRNLWLSSTVTAAYVTASNAIAITNSSPPATAAAAGTVGTIAWDTGFLYVCVAASTWKRAALVTW